MKRGLIIAVIVFALLSFVNPAPHSEYNAFSEKYFNINGNILTTSDKLIYQTAYYSINGGNWQEISLTGTQYGNHPFLLDGGQANLPNELNMEGTHFVILFSCGLVNNAWDCHGDGPGEAKWQLEVIRNQGNNPPSGAGSVAEFAQCLTNMGAIFYGSQGCGGCAAQRELFGDNLQYVNYVNCDVRKPECKAAGVDGYPTWIINNQKYEEGSLSFQRLSSISGCPAPN